MNHAQRKIIHALLAKTNLLPHKQTLVHSFTNGRTQHSSDMNFEEASGLINYLKTQDKETQQKERMQRKIISLAHDMGWHLPGTQKINMQRINDWCTKYGHAKKPLNDYTLQELPTLVTQFKKVYNTYITNF